MDFAQIVKSIANQNNKLSIHFGIVTAITTEATSTTTATGNVSNSSKAVTLTAGNSLIRLGMAVTGANISASTFVYSINGADLIMTKIGATSNATAGLTFSSTRLSIEISGSSTSVTGVRYLSSYTPTVADVVVMIINNGDIVVLGELT